MHITINALDIAQLTDDRRLTIAMTVNNPNSNPTDMLTVTVHALGI